MDKFVCVLILQCETLTEKGLLHMSIYFTGQAGEFGVERFPKQPDWPVTKNIKFKRPFSSSPSVVHGIIVLDSNGSRNLRGAATVSYVTNTGFTLRLSQWADTLLYSLKVRWMACR